MLIFWEQFWQFSDIQSSLEQFVASSANEDVEEAELLIRLIDSGDIDGLKERLSQ